MAQKIQTQRALGEFGKLPLGPAFDGFSVYVVGGAVRDAVRGETPTDIDLLAVPRPEAEILDPVETLSEREGMTRIDPESALPMFLDKEGREVTLPRKSRDTGDDAEYEDLIVDPTRQVSNALRTDLNHRDLTINALAFDIRAGMLLDPVGGCEDLYWGLLRPVGEGFSNDPLRVLRVARFAATLGFSVSEKEHETISGAVPGIMSLPGERIAIELRKTFKRADDAGEFFRILDEFGANTVAFPEIKFAKIESLAARLDALDTEAARWIALGREMGEEAAKEFATRLALSAEEQQTIMLGASHLSSMIEAATANDPEDGSRAAMEVAELLDDGRVDATTDDMLAVAEFMTGSRAFDPERAETRVEGIRQAQELIDSEEMFDRLNIKPSDLDDPQIEIDGKEFGQRLRAAQRGLVAASEGMT